MSEFDGREAFHAAIWQSPDDDLPRLVYADWLDERNEPDAAAFLRLLCAVRTCPPDVDRLRPLVADFRRAMVKVPPKWIEDVCPVPPAVVVGAWVDVDHEANREVLKLVRKQRSVWGRLTAAEERHPVTRLVLGWRTLFGRAEGPPLRPTPFAPPTESFVERVWQAMRPALTPAAACAVDRVPVLVDVWSGVVMAVAMTAGYCRIRQPPDRRDGWTVLADTHGASGDPPEQEGYYEDWQDVCWRLRFAADQFDPANRPG